MVAKQYLSISFICQCLRYQDGLLFWKNRPLDHFVSESAWKRWHTMYEGSEAGCQIFNTFNGDYRWIVRLSGKNIRRSVIVWVIHHQAWPTSEVDHKDRQSLNDKIENLRLATSSQQGANRTIQSNNVSGYKGVSWGRVMCRWKAGIVVNGEGIHLGYFDTKEEAHAAYRHAAIKYFGDFACF